MSLCVYSIIDGKSGTKSNKTGMENLSANRILSWEWHINTQYRYCVSHHGECFLLDKRLLSIDAEKELN